MKFWQSLAVAALLGSATETSASLTDLLCGLELSAECIYWKSFNSEFSWISQTANNLSKPITRNFYLEPDYQPGVGVAMRYRPCCSCWTFEARYHWVRPTTSAQVVVERPFNFMFITPFVGSSGVGSQAYGWMTMPYHAVETLASYQFTINKYFTLSPIAGINFFSIQRNYSARVDTFFGRGFVNSRFAGTGPILGIGGSSSLWCGLSCYGELLLAGTVGRKKILFRGCLLTKFG